MPICEDELSTDIDRLAKPTNTESNLNKVVLRALAQVDVTEALLGKLFLDVFVSLEVQGADECPRRRRKDKED